MLEQGVRVSGAIVSWSLSPTKREELEKLYDFCGLSNFLPGETTEVAALRAAMEDVKGKNQRVEALEKPSKHGYEIVLIQRGKVHNDHTTSFTAKVENGVVETGWGYTDTQALQARYDYRKSLLSPSSVSDSLGKLALYMNGTCLYPGTFWIPQAKMADWEYLAQGIEAIGEGKNRMRRLSTVFDEQTMEEVRAAITDEITKAVQAMEAEIGEGELGERALENRKERALELERRVEKYEGILEHSLDDLREEVKKVQEVCCILTMQTTGM